MLFVLLGVAGIVLLIACVNLASLMLSRGIARQREMAHRFGVNLVMYALTGNYKSDQVHVPAILERLGQ